MTEHDIELAKQAGFTISRDEYVFSEMLAKYTKLIRAEKQGEYEAMKKDAERYRWMRNYTGATYDGFYNIPLNNLRLPKRWMYGSIARHWDEAIDKAMEI